MINIIYTVFFVGFFRFSGADCNINATGVYAFGPDCQYMCHCKNGANCDKDTGYCDAGCAANWFGQACQYRDLVEGKKTQHRNNRINSSPQYASNANDGSISTCSYTMEAALNVNNKKPYWQVWFDQYETIRDIYINTTENGLKYFGGFEIKVDYRVGTKMINPRRCYKHGPSKPNSTNLHIQCYQPLVGNQVRIILKERKSQLVLCDVRIDAGRNIAYSTQVTVSSINDNVKYGPDKAIDGSLRSTSLDYCFVSGDAIDNWFRVDLGQEMFVSYVNITKYDNESLKDYQIQISNNTNAWDLVYEDKNTVPNTYVSLNITTRYFEIRRSTDTRFIICELQLFGGCTRNKCGYDCSKVCHCVGNENLDNKVSGVCSTGCVDGWTGVNGSCNTCKVGLWGQDCSTTCGKCFNGTCNASDGLCKSGCASGYKNSTYCIEECANNTYGINCSQQCSSHCQDICKKDTGNCTCVAGWKGSRCEEACGDGIWGMNCSNSCGNCLKGTCNASDGQCQSGCASGYQNTSLCTDECANNTYGINCSQQCSSHCQDICKKDTGNCTCVAGWKGNRCEQECNDNTYGINCSQPCSSHCQDICKKDTGFCSCNAGWKGAMCEEECGDGTFGDNCTETCGNKCIDTCSKVNGTCTNCIPGWKGNFCEEDCEDGTWGNACNATCGDCLNSTCNKSNGVCEQGCSSGYLESTHCTEKCVIGTWGYNCSEQCGRCQTGFCNAANGECTSGCARGYKEPPLCTQDCSSRFYGDKCEEECGVNCKQRLCDHINGSCTNGCTAGWLGDTCKKECSDGTYGVQCNKTCSTHCVRCNKVDGQCSKCEAGWNGTFCDSECYNGTYGDGCALVCGKCMYSVACHKTNGSCTVGCANGYEGNLCYTQTEPVVSGFPGAAVGGSVSAIIVIAIVAVGVIFVLRRKHLSAKSKGSTSSLQDIGLDDVCSEGEDTGEQLKIKKADSQNDEYYAFEGDETLGNQPRAIVLKELAEFVKTRLAKKKFFDKEFKDIPYGLQFPTTEARKEHNAGKNRYKAMYAYDHTRVVLSTLPSNPNSDYVNANYIKGYQKEKAYIATQGPSEVNVNDFWRMVWENNVQLIAMVTNLVENTKLKCIQYWEPVDHTKEYGEITVCTESQEIFAEFIIRRFKLSKQGETMSRSIVQYAYTAWPDKDVPSNTCSLLHFWNKVRKNDENKTHPWLVHCSAGVGRTGTFIALDILYDQGTDSGYVDINMCVRKLREQRVNLVQKEAQYAFLYRIMVEALVLPSSPVQLKKFDPWYTEQLGFDKTTGKTNLMLEFEGMDEDSVFVTSTGDKEHEDNDCVYANTQVDENKDKNRYSNILAADEFRPFLSSNVPGTNNYINAVYMPSYNDLHGYLMSQTPLPDTAVDCCRLIIEQEIHVIITFDDDGDNQVGVYLPSNGSIEVGPFKVTLTSKEEEDGYMIQRYCLVYKSKEHTVIQYIYKKWSTYTIVPEEPNHVLEFIHKVDEQDRQFGNKPTLIQCINGAERSGLFVVLMNVIERARMDEEVSIPQVIRYLRTRRHQIVPNYDQYKFCHDVILCYAESNSTYANM